MRTPAGTECKYYYQDFHRGRSLQECRLLEAGEGSLPWEPQVCSVCPVPEILRANNCPHMVLRGQLVRRLLRKQVKIDAYCTEHGEEVTNPYVGCGRCHPGAASVLAGKTESR